MASVSKREEEINKLLDSLYQVNNGEKINSWLDMLKTYNSTDGKIPGLLNSSKIQINTAKKDGVYNLILLWIKKNMDKFANYDFTGIPNKDFLFLDKQPRAPRAPRVPKQTKLKTIEDIEKWCSNPEIHPFNGNHMTPNSNEYQKIYQEAYKILKKNKINIADFPNKLPKNHLLFGDMDLLYYMNNREKINVITKIYENNKRELHAGELFAEHIAIISDKPTILEQELELIKKCFEGDYMKNAFEKYNKMLVKSFFNKNYVGVLSYPDRMRDLEKSSMYNDLDKETYWFIQLLENNRLNNGEIIIEYLQKEYRSSINNWMEDALNIYNSYKRVYKDIDDCFNPATGIIENTENKQYLPINDPLDAYFEEFEKKLEKIKNPKYSKLIDLTTFKPKKNAFFLNNAQYAEFKKVKDAYDIDRKKYEVNLELYEKNGKNGSSPKPPTKPVVVLPNGKNHTIGRELDPLHIKDEVIKSFKRDYKKALPIIEEYNAIKNMSYLELKKRVIANSPSSSVKQLIRDNELLTMTKEQIANDVLYDYSGLADKCSESIDILTNEELDDENYPLSKLQLMVRMKVYTPDRQRYRTECIYAPKLYNYLIKCINAKEPFINPVTKAKYTQENIEELMKVMRIIDPSLEVPVFIKHMNDTKLKVEYKELTKTYQNLDASFGTTNTIRYYKMYLSRIIGGVEYSVYNICTFPADIEAEGEFATGSADLNSYTMIVNIYKLFNEGRLLYNYIPPYRVPLTGRTGEYRYIKPAIHFNKYKLSKDWLNDGWSTMTKTDFINMFKHYAQEVNNYIY
jgi:hypothetical protein